MPVEVLGFSDVPDAGDILYSTDDDRLGRQVVQERGISLRRISSRPAPRLP